MSVFFRYICFMRKFMAIICFLLYILAGYTINYIADSQSYYNTKQQNIPTHENHFNTISNRTFIPSCPEEVITLIVHCQSLNNFPYNALNYSGRYKKYIHNIGCSIISKFIPTHKVAYYIHRLERINI